MSYTIKSFGTEIKCSSASELKEKLKNLTNQHVSVRFKNKHGMLSNHFISVDNKGNVTDTYTGEAFDIKLFQ